MKRVSKKDIEKQNVKTEKVVTETNSEEIPFYKKNVKYIFLILVLFSIFIDLYTSFVDSLDTELNLLLKIRTILIIPAIILGMLSVYFERNNLTNIINRLFKEENKQIINLIDKLKSAFTEKNFLSTFVLILIIGISVFTLFYKLDSFDIYSDEVQVTKAATGYYYTGEYKQWDFVKEEISESTLNRAKPHLFIVAQSYKLFGVNTWASRFPSALFGLFFIILLFFIGRFFIKDKTTVLLAVFSFALYYDFLTLGRWARMYAIVFPLFLISFYWLYRFVTEKNLFLELNSSKYKFVRNYLNYNYIYLPFLLVLVVLNLKIHQNTTVLFPVFLVFSVFSILLFYKEKKYITASVVAVLILLYQIINPYKVGFTRFSFFEIEHAEHYSKILFGYPFSEFTNVVFLTIGIFFIFLVKNDVFRKKYLMLFIISILTFVLFGYVFDYAPHYRYVSFITPLSVLLILATLFLTIKSLFNKYIQTLIVLLLVANITIKYANNFEKLYVENAISPAKPSIAHKTIVENYKKNDVIIRHYGPKRYLKGIDKDTKFINIGSTKHRSFFEIFEQIKKHKSGWIIWHTYFSGKLDKTLINYANLYFKKYNGRGIDNTGEEVFYYNEEMIHSIKEFQIIENIPVANLKLSNSYSIAFELTINNNTEGNIFTMQNDSINKIVCKIKNENIIVKMSEKDSVFMKLPLGKSDNIILIQSVEGDKTIYSLSLNENTISKKEIFTDSDLVKFKIVPYFNGDINKIRLYDFSLNQMQINEIQKDTKGSETLTVNDKEFRTLYLWQKK